MVSTAFAVTKFLLLCNPSWGTSCLLGTGSFLTMRLWEGLLAAAYKVKCSGRGQAVDYRVRQGLRAGSTGSRAWPFRKQSGLL